MLGGHPDRLFYYYICSGLAHGFRIGFDYGSHTCRSGKGNMQSVLEHPEVVSGYLQREVSLGRVKGPLGPEAASLSQLSPFGVIPKSSPGQWRLILDLSHPEGRSVNDGINPAWCSLSYVSIDNLIEVICLLGCGALLAKVDVQSAYRLVPVFPEDCWLLGMHWSGECALLMPCYLLGYGQHRRFSMPLQMCYSGSLGLGVLTLSFITWTILWWLGNLGHCSAIGHFPLSRRFVRSLGSHWQLINPWVLLCA